MSEEATSDPAAPEKSKIIDLLMEALLERYFPSGNNDKIELKSTLDLIDEMEPIAQIDKWQVQTAMELAGFKPRYTEAGFLWQLFLK